jgi:alanyl-tRNA synthetase
MLPFAEPIRSGVAVCRVVDGDMTWLKLLATEFASEPGRVAVLVSNQEPAGVVVATSPDTGVAANKLLAQLLTRFGGRGGGKSDLAQGGGLNSSPETVVAEAATGVRNV